MIISNPAFKSIIIYFDQMDKATMQNNHTSSSLRRVKFPKMLAFGDHATAWIKLLQIVKFWYYKVVIGWNESRMLR